MHAAFDGEFSNVVLALAGDLAALDGLEAFDLHGVLSAVLLVPARPYGALALRFVHQDARHA